jgi:hypothetical protein
LLYPLSAAFPESSGTALSMPQRRLPDPVDLAEVLRQDEIHDRQDEQPDDEIGGEDLPVAAVVRGEERRVQKCASRTSAAKKWT